MNLTLSKIEPAAAALLAQEGALQVLTWRELAMSESSGEVWQRMLKRALQEAKANKPKKGETVIIQMEDGPRAATADKIFVDWHATARAAVGKQVRNLSNKERFCIAFSAGVEIEKFTHGEPEPVPKIHWRTKAPCGIVQTEDGFRVYVA